VLAAINRMCRTGSEFTRAGSFLVWLTAIATLVFAWFLPFWLLPRLLPPGTRYPGLLIGIAIVGFGALFFASLARVMERIGFPATKPPRNGAQATPVPREWPRL